MSDYNENRKTDQNGGQKSGQRGVIVFIALLVLALAGLFVAGLLPRIERQGDLKKAHEETVGAVPIVHTVVAKEAKQSESITLPGNIGAIQYTTIYARVDGYLSQRLVDIGDQVKKGELIAQIETPTIDAALAQAQADLLKAKAGFETSEADLKEAIAKESTAEAALVKAKANVAYATVTAKRWQDMCERGSVSQQSRDEKVRSLDTTTAEVSEQEANLRASKAAVEAAKANVKQAHANILAKKADVDRLNAQQSFQKVLAPFDGIITLRKVDPGALITQGSQSTSLELYQMAKIDSLRIYVSCPQRIARYCKAGQIADVLVPEYPERKFLGTVTNVSGALDPNTRTRQTEIKLLNKEQLLLPGMYAEVKITALREHPWIRVPGTTVVTRTDGLFVVVIKDGKLHYQQITMGRDFGDEIEVRVGLSGGETVVVSPSDELQEGEIVKCQPLANNNAT